MRKRKTNGRYSRPFVPKSWECRFVLQLGHTSQYICFVNWHPHIGNEIFDSKLIWKGAGSKSGHVYAAWRTVGLNFLCFSDKKLSGDLVMKSLWTSLSVLQALPLGPWSRSMKCSYSWTIVMTTWCCRVTGILEGACMNGTFTATNRTSNL